MGVERETTQNTIGLSILSIWYSVPSRISTIQTKIRRYYLLTGNLKDLSDENLMNDDIDSKVLDIERSSYKVRRANFWLDIDYSTHDDLTHINDSRSWRRDASYPYSFEYFSNTSTFKVKKIIVTWGTTCMIRKRQPSARTERDRSISQLYIREEISPQTGKKRRLLYKIWRERAREDEQKAPYDKEESAYTTDFIDIDNTFDYSDHGYLH